MSIQSISYGELEIAVEKLRKLSDEDLEDLVVDLKGDALTLCHDAGSGHPGGTLSLMRPATVYFGRVYKGGPYHLSKGHTVPVLYSIFHKLGLIPGEEMGRFREVDGLSGHADSRVQAVPSGLLGQGGSVVNGMALAEYLKGNKRKVYGFFGDGEIDEGAMWEAFHTGARENLNVCYVIDWNKKNLTGPLVDDFKKNVAALTELGICTMWAENTVPSLMVTYQGAEAHQGPVAVIVDSVKGEGVSFMEDHKSGWHGDSLKDEEYKEAMEELGQMPRTFRLAPLKERVRNEEEEAAIEALKKQGYGAGSIATRASWGEEIAEMGAEDYRIVVIIPDIGGSVKTGKFAKAFPDRHFDVGIREQDAMGTAMGLTAGGYRPYVSTFDAFARIFAAQTRMADYGRLPVGIVLTHAEWIGADGASHQSAEDLGMWLGLHNIKTVINPADDRQMRQALRYAHNLNDTEEPGIFYIRASRGKVPSIYTAEGLELPWPGDVSVVRKGTGPVIIATGQEVWESLVAAEMLKEEGTADPTVANVAYFKPFDKQGIYQLIKGEKVFTVEAHNPKTGLWSLVSQANTQYGAGAKGTPLGIRGYIESGDIGELKDKHGLSAPGIARSVWENL